MEQDTERHPYQATFQETQKSEIHKKVLFFTFHNVFLNTNCNLHHSSFTLSKIREVRLKKKKKAKMKKNVFLVGGKKIAGICLQAKLR